MTAMYMCWYILSDTWSRSRSFRVAYAVFLVHGQPLPPKQTSAEGTLELALSSSGVFLPGVVHQPGLRLGHKRTPRLAAGPSVLGRCHALSSLLSLVFVGLLTCLELLIHILCCCPHHSAPLCPILYQLPPVKMESTLLLF